MVFFSGVLTFAAVACCLTGLYYASAGISENDNSLSNKGIQWGAAGLIIALFLLLFL